MTTSDLSPSPSPRARRRVRLGHWALVVFVAMAVVAVVEAASMLRLNRQAGEVRDVIGQVVKGEASTQVQFSVGSGVLGIARFVAGFIDDVPPEALHAMEAVDSASVGVYRLHENPSAAERIAIMNLTAERMIADGWYRVVAVQDNEELVMIFAPENGTDSDALRFCVVVCDGNDLVVVSAHGSAGPLREIAALHAAEWRHDWQRGDRDVL